MSGGIVPASWLRYSMALICHLSCTISSVKWGMVPSSGRDCREHGGGGWCCQIGGEGTAVHPGSRWRRAQRMPPRDPLWSVARWV